MKRLIALTALLWSMPLLAFAQRMLEPAEYLKDPRFKPLYFKVLGPKAKTPWLSKMDGPAPTTRKIKVGDAEYVLAAFCKDHDCGDHNAVLLYVADRGSPVRNDLRKGQNHADRRAAARGVRRVGEAVEKAMAPAVETAQALPVRRRARRAYLVRAADGAVQDQRTHAQDGREAVTRAAATGAAAHEKKTV